jgi:hypothetical protein
MMTWKILEVIKDGELISQAKYHVKLVIEDFKVETEGHWYFSDKEIKTNFSDVKPIVLFFFGKFIIGVSTLVLSLIDIESIGIVLIVDVSNIF